MLVTEINQIDTEQFEKIMKYIRSGVESGATLETGGERLGNKGYYIKPTVFSNVKVYLLVMASFYHKLRLIYAWLPMQLTNCNLITYIRMTC